MMEWPLGFFRLTGLDMRARGDLGHHQLSKQQNPQRWLSLAQTEAHFHPSHSCDTNWPVWVIVPLLNGEGEVISHIKNVGGGLPGMSKVLASVRTHTQSPPRWNTIQLK